MINQSVYGLDEQPVDTETSSSKDVSGFPDGETGADFDDPESKLNRSLQMPGEDEIRSTDDFEGLKKLLLQTRNVVIAWKQLADKRDEERAVQDERADHLVKDAVKNLRQDSAACLKAAEESRETLKLAREIVEEVRYLTSLADVEGANTFPDESGEQDCSLPTEAELSAALRALMHDHRSHQIILEFVRMRKFMLQHARATRQPKPWWWFW